MTASVRPIEEKTARPQRNIRNEDTDVMHHKLGLARLSNFFYNVEGKPFLLPFAMSEHYRPLGGFEQAVLLALVSLKDQAYGVSIRNELERQLDRSVSFGAVYTTLDRLLAKGLVNTHLGEPTAERGGRAKKFFTIDRRGLEALRHARHAAEALWAITPLPKAR